MKKIIFVEKQQATTYDPVSTFFKNTKPSSVSKPAAGQVPQKANPVKPSSSAQRPSSTKAPPGLIGNEPNINRKVQQKQKPVTNKIGKKGDHLPPKRVETVIKKQSQKQQSIYGMGTGSKKQIPNSHSNSRNKTNQMQQQNERMESNNYREQAQQREQLMLPNVNQRRSPSKQLPQNPNPNPNRMNGKQSNQNIKNAVNANNNNNNNRNNNNYGNYDNEYGMEQKKPSNQQLLSLRKRVKQLEEQNSQLEEKYIDMQQKYQNLNTKYNKLSKQHKMCGNQSKQNTKKLKDREEELKRLMNKDEIPYNKKREVLLNNQLSNLKKINRQLVMRIKNYRSTDLVQVSLMNNKTDILFKQYDHSVSQQNADEQSAQNYSIDVSKIQSLAYQLTQQIQKYLSIKNSNKQMPFVEDKKLLSQLGNLSKNLSLQCMNVQFRIPASNKQCINIYNQIEKYRNALQPLISKYDLNFVITQENIEFINNINEDICYGEQFKESIVMKWNQEPKKFKKIAEAAAYYLQKYKAQACILQRNTNLSNILFAHSLSQISFLQSWYSRMSLQLKESLNNLNARLKQIQQLSSLGQAGKQSLYSYIRTNIQDLVLKVPKIQMEIKEIGTLFRQVRANYGRNSTK